MSRGEDTHRRPLPDPTYRYDATFLKSLDGQYSQARKSTNLNNRYRTDEATDRKLRKQCEERQRRSEEKRILQANVTDFKICRLL